jgi:hypothetical protein
MRAVSKPPNPSGTDMNNALYARLVADLDRKRWWHVPPTDPTAYAKRGKFLTSSFAEAEFYGRPLDEPLRVTVKKPLVGDEEAISKTLRIPPQHPEMTLKQIAAHDVRWRNAALKKGFDAIVLMSPRHFSTWKATGRIPRSLELNALNVRKSGKIRQP